MSPLSLITIVNLFDDFMFQQDGTHAHRSHHTVAYLRSSVPEFTEAENWQRPPNSMGTLQQNGVSSYNFRH